jgi:hypothetical protein
MDGISWTDLDSDEQRAIAMLGAGVSAEFCDPVALITLTRIGLVSSSRLTPAGDQLRRAAALQELASHILLELEV